MAEALDEIGGYAGEKGVKLATETGHESPASLAQFLSEVDSPGLAVNYDPANLVMNGFDHLGGVKILAPWIVHTHAKDAVRYPDGRKQEVPLGEGTVDFPTYLKALREIGFDGYLTVEREVGDNPERDIRAAVEFLKTMDIR
jgi:sugar phosphate isomerase/epimerase